MVEPVSPRDLVRQAALIGAALLTYFGVRNLTAGSTDEAFANARSLVRLQDRLGLDWEHAVQGLVVDRGELVTLANWIYIWGHWPVILTTAVALYVFRRRSFHVLRNAMFISGAVGFLFFALLPLAPPRMLGLGLVDTVTEQSNAYRALQPPGLTNQYAAFPSLHAGWNLLVGVVLLLAGVPLLVRLFALVSPVAMAFAVVATANHYVLDVAAGYVVVLAALAVALRVEATLDARDRHGAPHPGRSAEPLSRRPPRREPARAAARMRPVRSAVRRG